MSNTATTLSPTSVVERARALAPELADRARQIEADRRVPDDLLRTLTAEGCFRMLLPRDRGGIEASLPEALALYEALAEGDASTAWIVMIGSVAWCDLASLPRASFDELFPTDQNVIVAGAFAPSGSITPVEGGYELRGRWAFASGCEHATVFFANAIEGFADGRPLMRASALLPEQVTIEDTWHVAGLRGSGSHHFSVNGVIVPAERTFVPLVDQPNIDVPVLRIPTPSTFSLAIAAVSTGTASGALDEVAHLAAEKVPLLAPGTLGLDPLFHAGYSRAATNLAAARSLLFDTAEHLWDRAITGDPLTLEDRGRARATAAWATEAALSVTEFAYRAGGGTAIYDECPLQRRLRDLHAMTQHFLVRPDTFVAAGQALTGHEPAVPVF